MVKNEKGQFKETHGLSRTRLYKIWFGMKSRCYNNNTKGFENWGGRGIIVCDEWLNDFLSFYNWALKNGYKDNLSIDRINNNGNYEPNNCRFITIQEQQKNKRPKRNGLRRSDSGRFVGVCFEKGRNKWRGQRIVNGIRIQTKRYNTEIEAKNELNKLIYDL